MAVIKKTFSLTEGDIAVGTSVQATFISPLMAEVNHCAGWKARRAVHAQINKPRILVSPPTTLSPIISRYYDIATNESDFIASENLKDDQQFFFHWRSGALVEEVMVNIQYQKLLDTPGQAVRVGLATRVAGGQFDTTAAPLDDEIDFKVWSSGIDFPGSSRRNLAAFSRGPLLMPAWLSTQSVQGQPSHLVVPDSFKGNNLYIRIDTPDDFRVISVDIIELWQQEV